MAPDDLVCLECGSEPAAQVEDEKEIIIGDWRVIQSLEVLSSEADLYVAQNLDESLNDSVVIKHYRSGFSPDPEVQQKIRSLSTPRCVHLMDTGKHEGREFEVYEQIVGGTLQDLPADTSSDPEFVRTIVRQLSQALNALESVKLIHRDLKPANILIRTLDPLEVSLSDFGTSVISEFDLHVTASRRTTRYASPESYVGVSSEASDWWSLGIIVLELLRAYPETAIS